MNPLDGILLGAGALVAGFSLFWFAPRRSKASQPPVAVALTEERWIRLGAGLDPEIVVVTGGVPVKLRFFLPDGAEPRSVVIQGKKGQVAVAPGRTVTVDFLHHDFTSLELTVSRTSGAARDPIEARGAIVVAPRPTRRMITTG